MATSDGTISYNSEKLHELATGLGRNFKTITDEVNALIKEAEGLAGSGKWTGVMYEAFMTNINNYKTQNIDPLCDVIEDYIKKIDEAAVDLEAQTQRGENLFTP